jgi:hypothetical protein
VVNVIEVTEAVTPQDAEVTDSAAAAFPPMPAAPANGGRRANPSSRAAAVAAALHALGRVRYRISVAGYWLVAMPVRWSSVKV